MLVQAPAPMCDHRGALSRMRLSSLARGLAAGSPASPVQASTLMELAPAASVCFRAEVLFWNNTRRIARMTTALLSWMASCDCTSTLGAISNLYLGPLPTFTSWAMTMFYCAHAVGPKDVLNVGGIPRSRTSGMDVSGLLRGAAPTSLFSLRHAPLLAGCADRSQLGLALASFRSEQAPPCQPINTALQRANWCCSSTTAEQAVLAGDVEYCH